MKKYLFLVFILLQSCGASFELISSGSVSEVKQPHLMLVDVQVDLYSREFVRALKQHFTSELKDFGIEVIVVEGNRLDKYETLESKILEYQPDMTLHFIQKGSNIKDHLYLRKSDKAQSTSNLFIAQSENAQYSVVITLGKSDQILWEAYLAASKHEFKPLTGGFTFSKDDGIKLSSKLIETLRRDGIITNK